MAKRILTVITVVIMVILAGAVPANATIADRRNDYNGDGVSDVLAIEFGGDKCLWRYNGTGTGTVRVGVRVGCFWHDFEYSVVAAGDLNSDGIGDLAAISYSTKSLYHWYGDGRGAFGARTFIGEDWIAYEYNLIGAGDLNNDGAGDLLATTGDGCMSRWLGNGRGGYGAKVELGCDWTPFSGNITGAGDLNRDGNADLVAISDRTNCLYRWYGNGRGGFGPATMVGCGWKPYVRAYDVAGMGDLNRDGIGDLVARNMDTDELHAWYGSGNGGFAPVKVIGRTGWLWLNLVS